MPNGVRHYAFTANNYSEDDISCLQRAVTDESNPTKYVIIGKEVSSTGTPHLQGHAAFSAKQSLSAAKKALGIAAHLTPARDIRKSIDYCKKDGSYIEFGVPCVLPGSNASVFEAFRASVLEGITDRSVLRETHPVIMARYPRFANQIIRDLSPRVAVPTLPLRGWQLDVLAYVDGPISPRQILFVVDYHGNGGKTYFADFLESTREKVQVMKPGKIADMAFEYSTDTKILVVDIPRSKCDHFQYSFLESVKDGRLFSSKYESETKRFISPHVLVMMNQDPDMKALSDDRYDIRII